MSHVVSLTFKPLEGESKPENHFARTAIERVTLVAGYGVEGDAKGRSDSRQLNVMLAEIVEQLRGEGFKTAPGELGEQIVIAGLDPNKTIAGVTLKIGESALVELVYLRVGCKRFEHIQGYSKEEAKGRLGFMARVLTGGIVSVGDPVTVVGVKETQESERLAV